MTDVPQPEVVADQSLEAGLDRGFDGLRACDSASALKQLRVNVDESFGHDERYTEHPFGFPPTAHRGVMFSW